MGRGESKYIIAEEMRDVSQVRYHKFNFQWTKIILSEPVNL